MKNKQNSSFLIEKFDDKDQWLNARNGKITGSKLKDIIVKRGTGEKKGFYQLIADRVAIAPDDENPMDRGVRLEEEAIARFVKETGKKVNTDLVIFSRKDNPNIAFSPDAYGDDFVVEAKCLSSASHIEAFITQKCPSEYADQIIQPFVVMDNLKTLYMVFYDPRIPSKDFFYLTITREDIGEETIEDYKRIETEKLALVEEWVLKLSF